MSNPRPKYHHLKEHQWPKGTSGNPNGRPVGSKNLSTRIREMINDESLAIDGLQSGELPIKAIIIALITLAVQGNMKAFELLAKYGYGTSPPIHLEEPADFTQLRLVIVKNRDDVESIK